MDRETKVSYLRAKDQTIVILSRANLKNCRVNLVDEMSEGNSSESVSDDKHIPVYLRIKGGMIDMELYEIKDNSLVCRVPEGSYGFRNLKPGDLMTRTYKFSEIFGPEASQMEIFNNIVKSKILDFINGRSCTLFTYGTSGSGKTFTIVGTSAEPGIIPRALEYIFRTIPKLSDYPDAMPLPNGDVIFLNEEKIIAEIEKKNSILKATHHDRSVHTRTYRQMQQRLSSEPVAKVEDFLNVSVSIWVSFAEIYNEHVFDLLKPLPKNRIRPKLQLGRCNGQIYIKDLTSVCVCNGLEAYQIHQYGIQNLNYAATALNSHSSRSHAIFTIKLVQTARINGETRISSLRFCDLAGSERSKKTLNIGDRLKESNNINRSLLVLGRCIEGVRTMQQVKDNLLVPFRESKLTQLFQCALLGQENIAMIVNLNPSKSMYEESQHALNFSAITKDIIIEDKPIVEIKPKNRFSEMLHQNPHLAMPTVQEYKENPEKDEKIESLENMVTDLYNEIENMRAEFDKEVLDEKRGVAEMYKKYIKEIREQHEQQLTERIDKQKEYYEKQMERLRTLLNEATECQVINLSSDSEDSFSKSYFENEIEDLREKCSLLENQIQELTKEAQLEKQELLKQIERLKQITSQETKEKKFTRQFEDGQLLNDAKIAYQDLEKEIKVYKAEIKKLLLENIKLKEQNEQLTMISFGGSAHSEPDEDNTHLSHISGIPSNTPRTTFNS